ncbi:MAG: hypothetical protein ABJ382_15940, partial [Ilumatobacter sp.]
MRPLVGALVGALAVTSVPSVGSATPAPPTTDAPATTPPRAPTTPPTTVAPTTTQPTAPTT